MEDKLAEALGLGPGARVLDAGCGVGHVAIRMARQHELLVKGIDLVDYHIAKAKRNIAAAGLSDREVTCELMDYHHLDNLEPSSFDGIYTMETFVHARNPKAAIEGFRRLLRPGGRIAMFEYENCAGDNPSEGFFNKELSRGLQTVNKYTAMPNNERSREEYEKMLQDAGFCDVKIEDYSKNVRPMTRFFFLLALIPYLFIRLFGLEKYFINTMGGVGVYVGSSHWSYLAISATKSIPATKLEENKV
jgi:cyclopropane fatty-acyl-phospholipid synthase-like methyltransferase